MEIKKITEILNQEPPASRIVERKDVSVKINGKYQKYRYIPVSAVEAMLDEIFTVFGWELVNFRWETVANEIIASADLRVCFGDKWITRTGSAAVMIQQVKGSKLSDIDGKFKNALEKDFPHLKSDVLTNAARSLGRIFGRDLNRDNSTNYSKDFVETIEAKIVNADPVAEIESAKTVEEFAAVREKYKSLAQDNASIFKALTQTSIKIKKLT
jgi:hypothetical protein